MSFSLNELWYDSKLSKMQSPFPKLLEEGKKGENPSSLLLFKKRKEGSFGSLSLFVMLLK